MPPATFNPLDPQQAVFSFGASQPASDDLRSVSPRFFPAGSKPLITITVVAAGDDTAMDDLPQWRMGRPRKCVHDLGISCDLPFYPCKAPPPSKVQPVPLPPVDPIYEPEGQGDRAEHDDSLTGSVSGLSQEAEASTNIDNATQPSNESKEAQSEVSILFLPWPKIVLCLRGLGSSQPPLPPPAPGVAITADGTPMKRRGTFF